MVVFRTRRHIDQLDATDNFLRIFSAPLKTDGRQLEAQAQRSVHVFKFDPFKPLRRTRMILAWISVRIRA